MANTYVEPTTATALNTGRIQYNEAMRAILTNFKSIGIPGASQITIDGVAVGEQDGMLYRSTLTNALYISDSVYGVNSPIGGKFTRRGIGNRIESSFSVISGSATLKNLYEIGELVGVLDTGKLYLKTANTGADSDYKDVGTTQGYTVDAASGVASFTGQNTSVIRLFATSNIAVGTTAPTQTLDVRGTAYISGNAYVMTNLGVGTTSPAVQLDVLSDALVGRFRSATSTSSYIRFDSTSTTYPYIGLLSGIATFGNSDASPLRFLTNSAQRMYVDAYGNVGIGTLTTLPSQLTVAGTGQLVSALTDAGARTATLQLHSTSGSGGAGGALLFSAQSASGGTTPQWAIKSLFTDGTTNGVGALAISGRSAIADTALTEYLRIFPGGNVSIGSTTASQKLYVTGNILATGDITAFSDNRLKSNIRTIDSALEKVCAMRGVYFNKDGKESTGVVAQEIEKVLPEVVHDGEYLSVAYGNIVGILIEAIKELQAKVDKLEKRA